MIKLKFGYSAGIPEGVKTAWGARLIAPDDLVWDRQDLVAENDASKQALVKWLNGDPEGTGALAEMRDELRTRYGRSMHGDEDLQHVLYKDAEGIIVANTNASCGYVYVVGYLMRSVDPRVYVAKRGPIPAERWERVYGWGAEEAARMKGTGEEVRLFCGEREIQEDVPDAFNMGYGGSGPHALAKAIVEDLGLEASGAPASYAALVPEVFFPAQGKDEVVIYGDDVIRRVRGAVLA